MFDTGIPSMHFDPSQFYRTLIRIADARSARKIDASKDNVIGKNALKRERLMFKFDE